MKTNTMRAPLYKAGAVILVMALLAYLTSASGGGVLDSVGQLIIGIFRLVQWAIAMVIGVSVCIAALISIFLFAVSLYDKEASASMYTKTKESVAELLAPVFGLVGGLCCRTSSCTVPAQPVVDNSAQLKSELQTIVAGEVGKVTASQQELNAQFASLQAKIQSLEEKTTSFAAAGQVEAIAGEIAASAKTLTSVQESVTTLEGKIRDTAQKLQAMTPEKMLGDLPARLEKLELQGEDKGFDPQPLTESIQSLQKDLEEVKKAQSASVAKSVPGGKGKKKA
jgi:hypothetical protein